MSEQQKTEQPKTKLFREKSLEAVESPESLNDYLHVTSPSVWLILAAVIALLIGAILWGILGHIDTKRQAAVITTEGQTICCVPIQSFDEISVIVERKALEIDGTAYTLDIPESGEVELGFVEEFVTDESRLPMVYAKSGLSKEDLVVCIKVAASFEDGIQSGQVITESINPISLLLQ